MGKTLDRYTEILKTIRKKESRDSAEEVSKMMTEIINSTHTSAILGMQINFGLIEQNDFMDQSKENHKALVEAILGINKAAQRVNVPVLFEGDIDNMEEVLTFCNTVLQEYANRSKAVDVLGRYRELLEMLKSQEETAQLSNNVQEQMNKILQYVQENCDLAAAVHSGQIEHNDFVKQISAVHERLIDTVRRLDETAAQTGAKKVFDCNYERLADVVNLCLEVSRVWPE